MIFGGHKKDSALNNMSSKGESYRSLGLETNPSNYGWYTCVHCGKKFRKGSIDIDHIIPQSKGGTNTPENLQCLCIHCNRSKGNKTDRTRQDLKERRQSLGQVKREQILKPKLQEERQKIKGLTKQLSDDDIIGLIGQDGIKNDTEILNELMKEARKRKLKV